MYRKYLEAISLSGISLMPTQCWYWDCLFWLAPMWDETSISIFIGVYFLYSYYSMVIIFQLAFQFLYSFAWFVWTIYIFSLTALWFSNIWCSFHFSTSNGYELFPGSSQSHSGYYPHSSKPISHILLHNMVIERRCDI